MDSANDVSSESADGATETMSDGPDSSPTLADPDSLTAEERRLREARAGVPWRGWGPISASVSGGRSGRLQRQQRRLVVFQS